METAETDSGLYVKTDKPDDLRDVSADIEITAPELSKLYLRLGVGNAETVVSTTDGKEINVGVGNIDSCVESSGIFLFDVGVRNIKLYLPPSGGSIELTTGIGEIDLGGIAVDGEVLRNSVKGTIDGGSHVKIYANVGVGNIELEGLFVAL